MVVRRSLTETVTIPPKEQIRRYLIEIGQLTAELDGLCEAADLKVAKLLTARAHTDDIQQVATELLLDMADPTRKRERLMARAYYVCLTNWKDLALKPDAKTIRLPGGWVSMRDQGTFSVTPQGSRRHESQIRNLRKSLGLPAHYTRGAA